MTETKEKKTSAKKTTKKSTTTAKAAEKKTVKATKETAKKTTAKAAEKKPAKATAKKTTEKKATTKSTAKKTTTTRRKTVKKVEAPVTPVKDIQLYKDVINWKKGEAHSWEWLYIEIKAEDLLTEIEAGADNMETCCKAMLSCMLEGDGFIVDPGNDRIDGSLTVRYYVDNLSPERKNYWDLNQ